MDFRHVITARLRLDAVVPDDEDEHVALMSAPGGWAHLPSGRRTSPDRTAEAIQHSVGHWERSRLGHWTTRLLVDRDRPVVAHLLEHDVASRVRAERAGLSLVWRGPDAGDPDPDAACLVFADRPLDSELLTRITAHA